MRFLGLDLAWSARNPSGVAAIDADGRVHDARADLRDDARILAWVREHLGATTLIGIDMPTIVTNATGSRPCERELHAVFGRYHAGPHPANLRRFPDGGRARRIVDALAEDGVVERLDLAARTPGRFALEVFPHPAHVRLFELDAIFRYKKKSRPWAQTLSEWSRYRRALAGLADARPPLRLPEWIPEAVEMRGYKAWDDTLDALSCAYIASFLWHWGTGAPHARVFGNLTEGYVVVPDRAVSAGEGRPERVMARVRPSPRKRSANLMSATKPFLSDVEELRRRARKNMEKGALTESYEGDPQNTIDILQNVLATEIVCVLRYTMHYVTATGMSSDSVKAEFKQHAEEEEEHMLQVAERINQLGGTPNFNPEGLASRAASQYAGGPDLVDMIKENLVAERIAVEHYQELVRYFADKDITTRTMLEDILSVEEEHANDMADLLAAHGGK